MCLLVWIPGYWLVVEGKYLWQGGRWLPERPGYAWQAPEWRQRSDGLWYMVGGNWVRTDDYAYGRRMEPVPNWERDRDGDGVADRFDRFPDDPRRY